MKDTHNKTNYKAGRLEAFLIANNWGKEVASFVGKAIFLDKKIEYILSGIRLLEVADSKKMDDVLKTSTHEPEAVLETIAKHQVKLKGSGRYSHMVLAYSDEVEVKSEKFNFKDRPQIVEGRG